MTTEPNDDREFCLQLEDNQRQRDETIIAKLDSLRTETSYQGNLRGLYFGVLFLLISMNTCISAGCVTAPMDEWRDEVELSCYTAVDRLERGCRVPSRVDCAADMAEADGAGCLGPYERVLACWSREDVVVACDAWGPDVGSQCDRAEWELRVCLWPELEVAS